MKQFALDVEFVVRYLGFLISINDDTSKCAGAKRIHKLSTASDARALFESVISSFTPEKARPLWERWARYEYHFGDFVATQRLEKRIAEVYSNGMIT
jgi:cleavage stimulation factor subunit 3